MSLVRLYFRSFVVLGILFSMVFALGLALLVIGGLGTQYWYLAAIIALLWVFIQFLISPWLMDFTLPWLYDMQWYSVENLPLHLSNFIHQFEIDHKFNFKHIGIIEDDNPNAFTYGHFRKNARMVISRGIFTFLTNEEQQAVIAHEIGHVVHRDFIWMTIASAIPVLAYTLYIGLRSSAFRTVLTTKNKDQEAARYTALLSFLVAVGAWVVYFVTGYLVLLLSRIREYYADNFSAEQTGRPDDLGRALVKIAYGMIVTQATQAGQQKQGTANPKSHWQNGFQHGIRTMGIFDSAAAHSMSMSIQGRGKELDPEAVALAASWDLSIPWARFFELHSSHPLAAKRLKVLDKYAVNLGRQPQFPDIGKVKPPESLWDEFLIELFLEYILPILIIVFPLMGAIIALYAKVSPFFGASIGMFLVTILWWYRKTVKYPYVIQNQNTVEVTFPLIDQTKNSYYEASPVRGKSIAVEGTVIGRGTPGYYLSEDFVVQDETGIVRIDYQPILFFLGLFFALFRVPKLLGTDVRVVGWYHRAPMPTIKVWRVYTQDRTFENHWAGLNIFIILFLLLLAIIFFVLGLYTLL